MEWIDAQIFYLWAINQKNLKIWIAQDFMNTGDTLRLSITLPEMTVNWHLTDLFGDIYFYDVSPISARKPVPVPIIEMTPSS